MASKLKTAVFGTVALGGYGGSKVWTMDIWKGDRKIQLQTPNLIRRVRNGPSRGEKNRFLPHQLDYKQEQLRNHPNDEPYILIDSIQ
jgi:hypothetical protein